MPSSKSFRRDFPVLFQVLNHGLAVLAGGKARNFLKGPVEGGNAGKAGIKGNVDDLGIRVGKQGLGALDPLLRQKIIML